MIKDIYHKIAPSFLKKKIRYIYNPVFTTTSVGNRIEDYVSGYKKQLIKNAQKKNNFIWPINKTHKFLHEAFNKHEVRSNLIKDQWWEDFMSLTKLPAGEEFEKINQSLIRRIENSNFDSLEYWEVMNIYSFTILFGLNEMAYHLRKKAFEIALNYPFYLEKYNSWKLKGKLSAYLEKGRYSEFESLFTSLKYRQKKKYIGHNSLKVLWSKEEDSIGYLKELLSEYKSNSNISILKNYDTDEDFKFRQFVQGKKIAIVGPQQSYKKDGYEIDNSDIVIRFNYFADNNLSDPTTKGSRCDISYFNGKMQENFIKDYCENFSSDLKWVISKDQDGPEKIVQKLSSNLILTKSFNIRSIKKIDHALFKGNLTALPNVVVDLARFNPSKINIFHADLMLSKKKNEPNYISAGFENYAHIGLAKNHDPITQFWILNFFWKRGLIKGDDRFVEIMNMGAENYMKEFQKNYRKSILIDNLNGVDYIKKNL